jgi:hypothetical protein
MLSKHRKRTSLQILISIGAIANIVVCIYAVILAILNILTSAHNILFVLFYIFVPLPFYLRGIFYKMHVIEQKVEPQTTEWPHWVWASCVFGIIVSLLFGGWLVFEVIELTSTNRDVDASVYIVAGIPISMFVGASILLALLIRDRLRLTR